MSALASTGKPPPRASGGDCMTSGAIPEPPPVPTTTVASSPWEADTNSSPAHPSASSIVGAHARLRADFVRRPAIAIVGQSILVELLNLGSLFPTRAHTANKT